MVATYEKLLVGYNSIDLASRRLPWLAVVGVIRIKTVGVVAIIHCIMTVFENNSLAREPNDTLDDEFVLLCTVVERVFEYNDLSALRNIGLILELRDGDRYTIHDEAITSVERVLHAWAFDIKATKDKTINKYRTYKDTDNENKQTEDVFGKWMFFE